MRDVKELLSVSQGSDAVEMWPNVPILHGGRAVTNNTSSSMRNKKGCGGDRVSHDCLARFTPPLLNQHKVLSALKYIAPSLEHYEPVVNEKTAHFTTLTLFFIVPLRPLAPGG